MVNLLGDEFKEVDDLGVGAYTFYQAIDLDLLLKCTFKI